jgi:hypothetical protein
VVPPAFAVRLSEVQHFLLGEAQHFMFGYAEHFLLGEAQQTASFTR